MGVDLYAGFKQAEKHWGWFPTTDEAVVAYVQCATGEWVEQGDLDLYRELRDRYHNESNLKKSEALWKVLRYSPFCRMDGSLGRFYRLIAAAGVQHLADDESVSSCTDKEVIRRLFEAAGLRPDAADLVEEVYWG